ncbi:MAG: hypothetical protein QM661_07490 [Solimonas sp.]
MHVPDFPTRAETRALAVLSGVGADVAACERLLLQLRDAGLRLFDMHDEFACRWIDVRERAVPADADTLIRTLTRTIGERSWSATYWLEGLRAPAMPGPA